MFIANLFRVKNNTERIYGLDILRAVAILFVLNVHSALFFNKNSLAYRLLTSFNLDGVTLFFVLSGFLIGGLLIRQFNMPNITFYTLLSFWLRRWFRTLPAYFLVLLILLILGFCTKQLLPETSVKGYFFFLANFNKPMPNYLFPESWSLAVEEWFYILVPAAVFISITVFKINVRYVVFILAFTLILGITAFRYYRFTCWPAHLLNGEVIDLFFRKQVSTRLDCIMYGVLGSYIAYYHTNAWKRYPNTLFIIGVCLLYLHYVQYIFGYFGLLYSCVFAYSVPPLGVLCLLPRLTLIKTGKGMLYKSITLISIISYSLYLLNYSLVREYLIEDLLNPHLSTLLTVRALKITDYTIFWIFTVAGGILFYKYFEQPMTLLRERGTPLHKTSIVKK
ncbi:acyltransferase [Mucilaginibacter sp. SMC90]|uniref:acyltransferase family protein n=1 Tax=Mucilaginibacter sp. SMC90 TaxID=2929803 RepID=UPI001FB4F4F5|nr:acyltransferase [Mucilaginibacter sp. SMC90]UOE46493.1 acyltransferase [Mucilaginibacter sp. SMC90]